VDFFEIRVKVLAPPLPKGLPTVSLPLFKTELALSVCNALRFVWYAVHATHPGAAPAAAMRLLRETAEFADAKLIRGMTYTAPIFGQQGPLKRRRGRLFAS
jgi:hypothetical protein